MQLKWSCLYAFGKNKQFAKKSLLFIYIYKSNSAASSASSSSFLLSALILKELMTGSDEYNILLIRQQFVSFLEVFLVKTWRFSLNLVTFLLEASWASSESIPIGKGPDHLMAVNKYLMQSMGHVVQRIQSHKEVCSTQAIFLTSFHFLSKIQINSPTDFKVI